MLKERARQVSLMVAALDLVLIAVSFLLAWFLRAKVLTTWFDQLGSITLRSHLWMLFVALPTFHVLFRHFNMYNSTRTATYPKIAVSVIKPFLMAGPVLGSLIFLFHDKTFSRPVFVGFLAIALVLILLEKLAIKLAQNLLRVRGFNYHRVLMVGTGPAAARLSVLLGQHDHLGMRVIGHLSLAGDPVDGSLGAPILGPIDKLTEVLDNHIVDEVIFAAPASQILSLEPYILKCEEVGVKVHLRADFVSTVLSRTYTSDIEGIPILTFSSTPHSAKLLLVKRAMDLVISAVGLVVLSPLMLLIAAAIKATSPGPVFHRQERTGLNGRRVSLLKFRSMRLNAEKELEMLTASNEMTGPVFKMRNDPRVTTVGRWLRRMSLDELPQLWNILRGDMSLVGPRPPIPREVEQYHRWQRRRLSMKPGLTCLWQVNGRNNVDFDTWMKLDMEYIDNWSLLLDFKILARTVSAVILARGAH